MQHDLLRLVDDDLRGSPVSILDARNEGLPLIFDSTFDPQVRSNKPVWLFGTPYFNGIPGEDDIIRLYAQEIRSVLNF